MEQPQTLGNQLNAVSRKAQSELLRLGELSQLSYNAYVHIVTFIKQAKEESYEIKYPIGMNADGTSMIGKSEFTKENYINNYKDLAFNILPLNGLYQLVTAIETMLGDLMGCILSKYPQKITKKKSVSASLILGASSLTDAQNCIIGSYLNELSYKSPREYAEAASTIFGFNILEIPCYHSYIEIKATRDIHIHNQGIGNEIYRDKSGSHARVHGDEPLPVTNQYFLHSYEHCLLFAETLEKKFHEKWQSTDRLERKKANQAGDANSD